jgi:hypothetical protein
MRNDSQKEQIPEHYDILSIPAMRSAEKVMTLARLGSFHQSRLSFMRVLLRRLKTQNWHFERSKWDIDDNGEGTAIYDAIGPERRYSLVVFSHDIPAEKRSDRVIADTWDATFALVDGSVDNDDITRLARNIPLQEAGRISEREFVLSRANRSVRMFDYVRDCLAAGQQPGLAKLEHVGYLMRTTAVYGSGKFGAADRELWAERSEFAGSFQPELLAVWLIRSFTIDLVEHMAMIKSPSTAVGLVPDIRRRIGIGNSTGLGMAPFLINHPALIHAWINARETALARVRAVKRATNTVWVHFKNLTLRAGVNAENWITESAYQATKTAALRNDLVRLSKYLEKLTGDEANIWEKIYLWAEDNLSLEGQEQLVSLIIDVNGPLVDELANTMTADEAKHFPIDGNTTVTELRAMMLHAYGWTASIDYTERAARARVWYVSEEKLEPRLGERFDEPIEPYEQPLAPGYDAVEAMAAIERWLAEDNDNHLGAFLFKHPEHRHIVRRCQISHNLAYAEIRDNTISGDMLPIDLLRCKLSFFGASKFDPRSDRWLRITMYQGAPFPDELERLDPDDLAYPPVAEGNTQEHTAK